MSGNSDQCLEAWPEEGTGSCEGDRYRVKEPEQQGGPVEETPRVRGTVTPGCPVCASEMMTGMKGCQRPLPLAAT